MRKTAIYNNITREKTLRLIFLSGIVVVLLYVFFIGVMSVSAARMESAQIQQRILGSRVSELEYQYLSLSKDITLSYAYSLGFKEPHEVLFADIKTFASK